MKIITIRHILIAILSLSGCATDATSVDQTVPPLVLEQSGTTSNATTRVMDTDGSAAGDLQREPIDLPGSACTCTTQECMAQWIGDTVGCGIAVDIVCADGSRIGGMLPCDDSPARLTRALPYRNVTARE